LGVEIKRAQVCHKRGLLGGFGKYRANKKPSKKARSKKLFAFLEGNRKLRVQFA
jgi:hypothetical protein